MASSCSFGWLRQGADVQCRQGDRFDATPGTAVEEFAAEAPRHPVFRLG